MLKRFHMNDGWRFSEHFQEEMLLVGYDDKAMVEVRIPHTNVVTPYHYFDENIYQFVSCYRKEIKPKQEWQGKRLLITFEGVAHIAKVYMNGRLVTTHYGGYTAFTADITNYIDYNVESNILALEVDSREQANLPPFGNVIDYLTYGGIYREVYLEVKEAAFIEDVFVHSEYISLDRKKLKAEITLGGADLEELRLRYELYPYVNQELVVPAKDRVSAELYEGQSDHMIDLSQSSHKDAAGQSNYMVDVEQSDHFVGLTSREPLIKGYEDKVSIGTINFDKIIEGVAEWSIETPNLYILKLELCQGKAGGEMLLDEREVRFGFRTCEFKEDGFYLNRKKVKLLGLNRHQSFPYVGYAMPKRMQRRDAEILKRELCVNAVRTSHYPQSRHFIDRCDELGLLVFTEIPGWQHIGDATWKEIACEHVREMVLQYRNHPSVILWGVRINESQDDNEFYLRTNEIAHQLDPSRQTGGVRYLKKSNLLEDVYTYNDFLHNGSTKGLDRREEVTSDLNAPYMVTEFNGHMYPTKSFDCEEHRLEHALRHARVLEELFKQEKIAGGFGWCMFDYNTHKDFGSGDRICYHGVLDMFRNPKLAAAVYASQATAKDICVISSSLDIGEHPASNIGNVYAFTNADSIRLYKNDVFIKEFYPDREMFGSLPHPPIVIDDFVGDLLEKQENYSHKTAEDLKEVLMAVRRYGQNSLPIRYKLKMAYLMLKEHLTLAEGTRLYWQYIGNWGGSMTTFRFEALKNNKVIQVIEKRAVNKPRIRINVDTRTLREEETYDVSALRISVVDEYGNLLPYYQEPLFLEVSGAIELIGPKTISLKGGAGGTFVRTRGISGEGVLRITQEDLGAVELSFQVDIL